MRNRLWPPHLRRRAARRCPGVRPDLGQPSGIRTSSIVILQKQVGVTGQASCCVGARRTAWAARAGGAPPRPSRDLVRVPRARDGCSVGGAPLSPIGLVCHRETPGCLECSEPAKSHSSSTVVCSHAGSRSARRSARQRVTPARPAGPAFAGVRSPPAIRPGHGDEVEAQAPSDSSTRKYAPPGRWTR
jgi:hypothetical protein